MVTKKEFFSFQTSEGTELNGWMIKPANFSASKKYPVLMYQYSGPGSQQVLDKFGVSWETYMASQGYVVVCVDGRGTGGRGAEFGNGSSHFPAVAEIEIAQSYSLIGTSVYPVGGSTRWQPE